MQIRSSSSGNLKLISVPVINDPSRHFSLLACSGMRQKIWKSDMCAELERFNRKGKGVITRLYVCEWMSEKFIDGGH